MTKLVSSISLSSLGKLPVSLSELCINTTLRCGQSFRWRNIDDEWHCVLYGRLVSLRQDDTHLHYRTTWRPPTASEDVASEVKPLESEHTESLLQNYFNLHLSLSQLYEQWSRDDTNFRKKAPSFNGIRILKQDAWEALIAFICSSNNNISRISQMVQKLCLHYGPFVGNIKDEPFHDFPTPEALAGSKVEAHLRELGFGYRAKYIADTARILTSQREPGFLEGLRNPESPSWGKRENDVPAETPSYKYAHEQLLQLSGVGPKVADCVCLMGLGWGEAVPVDTHVWQIAVRDYKFAKAKSKTFSKVMHEAVGDHFRGLWGKYAGWAQSVLFTANLKTFSDRLTVKVEDGAVKVKEEDTVEEVIKSGSRKRKVSVKTVEEWEIKPEEVPAHEDSPRALRASKRGRTVK